MLACQGLPRKHLATLRLAAEYPSPRFARPAVRQGEIFSSARSPNVLGRHPWRPREPSHLRRGSVLMSHHHSNPAMTAQTITAGQPGGIAL